MVPLGCGRRFEHDVVAESGPIGQPGEATEEIAQMSVRDVLVGIAGGHIQCTQNSATIDVANSERGVTRADIRRAVDKATSQNASMEREVIHVIPQRFVVDDGAAASGLLCVNQRNITAKPTAVIDVIVCNNLISTGS